MLNRGSNGGSGQVISVQWQFKKGDKAMKMNEIREKAKAFGIKVMATTKKADLIRQIQKVEGNYDCFGTAKDNCDQLECCFREDCLPSIKLKRGGNS